MAMLCPKDTLDVTFADRLAKSQLWTKGSSLVATGDKRDRVRVGTSKPVEFMVQGRPYFGSITNMAGGGAFIETTQRFSVGQDLSVTYVSGGEPEERSGKIVRVTPKGIAVQFNFPGYYG